MVTFNFFSVFILEDLMKKSISAIILSAVVLSVLSLSACGDDQNSEASVQADESSAPSVASVASEVQESSREQSQKSQAPRSPISSSQIAQMKSYISSYQKMPEFNSKADAIDARSIAQNKTVTLICDDLNLTYTKLVVEQFKVAAEAVKFAKIVVAKTDGTEDSINKALNTAVNDKSDIVILFGNINKDKFSTNIEYAQANGIEVVSAGCITSGQNDHFADYTMPVDYDVIGRTLADWAITKTDGKLEALAINCTDSVQSNTVANGFKNEFDRYIADVTGHCHGINISSSELDKELPDSIEKALKENKNINYIIVFDESMISDTVDTLEQLAIKLPVISTGGSDEAFTAAQRGSLEMLVAQSYEWTAYGMVDYSLRILGNADIPKEQYVPFRVLTSDIINDEIANFGGISGNFNRIAFGSYFEYGYDYLWQL